MSGESRHVGRGAPPVAALQRSPGSMSGERSRSAVRTRRRCSSRFNGAPARCPGRARGAGRGGAPIASTEPRLDVRGEACVGVTRGVRAASTEPRLDVRGEARATGSRRSPRASLQRSPGSMSGESCVGATTDAEALGSFNGAPARCPGRAAPGLAQPVGLRASTEPRLDVRGELDLCSTAPRPSAGASTEPRLDVRGEPSYAPD